MTNAGLDSSTLTVKRPFWSVLGRKFYVYSPDGALVAFVKKPRLKLRMEFTIYSDEAEAQPLLLVKARQVLAMNVCYDVFHSPSGQRVGTLRQRGLKSMVRDTWDILDQEDRPIGVVEESGRSLLRRVVPLFLGRWKIVLQGKQVGAIHQVFRVFADEFTLDLSNNQGRIDPRFAVACAIFALMAETERDETD